MTSQNRRKSRRGSNSYSIARRLKAQQDSNENSTAILNVKVDPNVSWRKTNLQSLQDTNKEKSSSNREHEKPGIGPLHIQSVSRPWFILLPHSKFRIGWDMFSESQK